MACESVEELRRRRRPATPSPQPGRVVADPPPPPIAGVELTQGIQYFPATRAPGAPDANAVPLIAGKPLVARVYLVRSGPPAGVAVISADVEVTRSPAPGKGPDLVAQGVAVPTAQLSHRGRTDAAASLNVVVAGGDLRGTADLVVVLRGWDALGQSREITRHRMRVTFVCVPSVPVAVFRIDLDVTLADGANVNVPPPDTGECVRTLDDMEPFFPVADLHPAWWSTAKVTTTFDRGPTDVARALGKHITPTVTHNLVMGVIGAGWLDPKIKAGTVGHHFNGAIASAARDPGSGAHELGHLLGRAHTGYKQRSTDPDYPVASGAIDEVGLRVGDGAAQVPLSALDPAGHYDYMGGGGPSDPMWTSAYGYLRTLPALRDCAWQRRLPRARWMLVDVAVDGNVATIGPSYVLDMAPPAPRGAPSDVSIELVGADGRALARTRLHELELPVLQDDPGTRYFLEAIPWDDRAVGVVVRQGRAGIGAMTFGAPPGLGEPIVAPPFPGADGLEVRWTADADPAIRSLVRYTPDDGARWITLGVDLEERRLALDLGWLPSGPAPRVEVAASRLGSTEVESTVLPPIAPRSPRVVIVRPQPEDPGQPVDVRADEEVLLAGTVISPDAPPPRPEDLLWRLGGPGGDAIGLGAQVVLSGARLPDGVSAVRLLHLPTGSEADVELRRVT